MSKKLVRLCLSVVLLAALAPGPTMAADASAASVDNLPLAAGALTRPAAASRQSVLYKVVRDGRTAYLFGTIHVGTSALYPLAPEVTQALGDSTELVLELDTRSADAYTLAVLAYGSYGKGERIERHIAPATLEKLTTALHAQGITVGSVAHLKPWLIANILMGLELHRSGYERAHGNESVLLAHAQAHGTPVTELESADYQLALFDTLSEAQGESYLLECLSQLADGTSLGKAKATIDAWTSGKAAALDALVPDAVSGGSVVAEFTRHVLLGRRNPEMVLRIERVMQGGRTAFVAVGLLHLLGADGLPRLLSQRGYIVERMY